MKRSRLSFTAAKAVGWPCAASALPRARRCESICISVAVADAAALWPDCLLSRNIISAANTRNITISTPSVWNCLVTGRSPMTHSFRGAAEPDVAERSWSMIDTDASGSYSCCEAWFIFTCVVGMSNSMSDGFFRSLPNRLGIFSAIAFSPG